MLDGEGRLQLDAFVPDTLLRRDYRRLYEALDYVADHDTLAFARFGVELGKVREAVPDVFRDYVVYGYDYRTDDNWVWVYPDGVRRIDLAPGYRVLYANLSYNRYDQGRIPYYRFEDDTLRIDFGTDRPEFVISAPALLQRQLRRAGKGDYPLPSELENAANELLTYSDEELLILFFSMSIERRDSALRLDDVDISAIMAR